MLQYVTAVVRIKTELNRQFYHTLLTIHTQSFNTHTQSALLYLHCLTTNDKICDKKSHLVVEIATTIGNLKTTTILLYLHCLTTN
jgi:hypothetical protein